MSGPKMSAADIKKYRLFEQDRRRLYQNLVRLGELQKRRLGEMDALIDLCMNVSKEDAVKFRMQKLDGMSSEIKASLEKIQTVMNERNNEEMQEVLQNVSSRFEHSEEFFAETESFVNKVREEYFRKMMTSSGAAAGTSQETADSAGAQAAGGALTGSWEEKVASFEDIAKEETARVLRFLHALKERASDVHVCEKEVAVFLEEVSSLAAEGRDAFSLYEETHRIDVMRIRPVRDRIEKEETRLDELDLRLSDELSKYHVLCAERGMTPKKFAFEEASIEAIRYECAGILAGSTQNGDLRILMKNVRESLVKLGYSYLGEKEEDRDFAREIYRIHDDVILHVIYDSTGRVTMEVAVEDEKDREPHPREVEKLVKEQVNFCSEYEKIFHAINEKGLAFRKENMYPVSPDFAQVINTSGFVNAGAGSAAGAAAVDDYFEMYGLRESKYLVAER